MRRSTRQEAWRLKERLSKSNHKHIRHRKCNRLSAKKKSLENMLCSLFTEIIKLNEACKEASEWIYVTPEKAKQKEKKEKRRKKHQNNDTPIPQIPWIDHMLLGIKAAPREAGSPPRPPSEDVGPNVRLA